MSLHRLDFHCVRVELCAPKKVHASPSPRTCDCDVLGREPSRREQGRVRCWVGPDAVWLSLRGVGMQKGPVTGRPGRGLGAVARGPGGAGRGGKACPRRCPHLGRHLLAVPAA